MEPYIQSAATRRLVILAIALLTAGREARAIDLGGTARLLWVDTDFTNGSNRNLEQQYNLDLSQQISPFLTLALRYSHFQLDSEVATGDSLRRRFRQPTFDALYSRPNLSARLRYEYRLADGTADPDNFEAEAVAANLFWRVRPDLSLSLNFRDDVNDTDVSALGRDTETQLASALLRYDRRFWGASYGYSRTRIDNRLSGVFADQDRHDAKFRGSRGFFDQRLLLGLAASYGRSGRTEEVRPGADLAEPIPAVQGLFALDLSPAIGELEPAPGLIDGDLVTPVSPPIEIGGANTFRNLGLDLGVTRPISRLEVSVDRPSGSEVVWEVYQSRDNLFWEPVAGARSEFDPDRLVYAIFFSETENRFFKAVNVSTNAAPLVQVTELRALREIDTSEPMISFDDDRYRIDFSSSLQIAARIRAFLLFGTYNDQSIVADLLARDRQDSYANGGIDVELARSLYWNVTYRWADSEDRREERLDRTTNDLSSNLRWTPLPTVDLIVTVSTREESEREVLLQKIDTSRVGLDLQLLSTFRLYSDLSYSTLEDPFSGFDRDTLSWTQRFTADLLRSWSLSGGYNYQNIETPNDTAGLDRVNAFAETRWSPGSFLVLRGGWRFTTDDFTSSVRQSYGISYTPGPRLSFNASWNQLDSDSGLQTGNGNIGAAYRLHANVLLSASLTRSRSRQAIGVTSEVTSGQLGLTIGF